MFGRTTSETGVIGDLYVAVSELDGVARRVGDVED